MRHALMIVAALGLLTVAAPSAYAQKIDANGRCHGKDGKFAKMDVCKGLGEHHLYMQDAKGICHDEKGKFAEKEMCKR